MAEADVVTAPPRVVVGAGASTGVDAEEVLALVEDTLRGPPVASVGELATVGSRAAEPGRVEAARRLGVPLVAYGPRDLARVEVPHPSAVPLAAVGTPSVAEAAALLGGGDLLVPKRTSARTDGRPARATCAVGRRPGSRNGTPAPPAPGADGTHGTITGMDTHSPPRPAPAAAPPSAGPAHDLRHHGDAEVRDSGAALVDLAVNVRADTPPAWLRERIAASLTGLAAYPDGRAARAAVAARHGVPAERVLLTAGAAEAFVLLARALPARRPVVVHPQFTEPEAALRDAGHT